VLKAGVVKRQISKAAVLKRITREKKKNSTIIRLFSRKKKSVMCRAYKKGLACLTSVIISYKGGLKS
jgi:hypothetical protein